MTKSRRLYWIRDSLSNSIFTAPQSAARSAGSNRRFKFEKRPQFFIRTHNVTLAAIAAIIGQHCSLNRWIQTTRSSSKNAVSFSSACTTNR
jgi:hypothetical protein